MELNKRLIKASSKGGVRAVLEIVSEQVMLMNGMNLSTVLHRVAKSCAPMKTEARERQIHELHEHEGFRLLLQRTRLAAEASVKQSQQTTSVLDFLLPTDSIGIIVWSLACLNVQDMELMHSLAKLAIRDLASFHDFQAVNVIWGFAKLGLSKEFPTLFDETFKSLHKREPGSSKPHSLAMAVWAFASVEFRDIEVIESLVAELRPQMHNLNSRALLDVCWAFTKQKIALPEGTLHLLASDSTLDGMDSEHICNICGMLEPSLTPASEEHPAFLHKLGMAALKLVQDMSPSQLSIVLSAYAQERLRACPDLIARLFAVIIVKAPSFSALELVNVTQYAAQGYPFNKSLLDALGTCTIMRLQELEYSDLAALANAFRQWEEYDASASWVVDEIIEELNSQEVSSAMG